MTIQSAPPAGIGRRLGALMYDALLVLAIWMCTGLLALPFTGGEAASGPFFQLILFAEWCGFNVYFWCGRGQTLGMRAWRLRVVNQQGEAVSLQSALLRLVAAPVSLACAGLGYLWFYVGQRQQTWHDIFSHTFVVQLEKEA